MTLVFWRGMGTESRVKGVGMLGTGVGEQVAYEQRRKMEISRNVRFYTQI